MKPPSRVRMLWTVAALCLAEYLLWHTGLFAELVAPVFRERMNPPPDKAMPLPPLGCDACNVLPMNTSLYTCVNCVSLEALTSPAPDVPKRIERNAVQRRVVNEYYWTTHLLTSYRCELGDGFNCPTALADRLLYGILDTEPILVHPATLVCAALFAVVQALKITVCVRYWQQLQQAALYAREIRNKEEEDERQRQAAEQAALEYQQVQSAMQCIPVQSASLAIQHRNGFMLPAS